MIKPFKPNSFQLLTGCITLIALGGWLINWAIHAGMTYWL